MEYVQALDYMFRHADLERSPATAVRYRDFNLPRVEALLTLVGSPHLALPTVHIAGTKGKGSTSAMVASILEAANLTPGLFTSPHLHTVRERMTVRGRGQIAEAEFAAAVEILRPAAEEVNRDGRFGYVTTFELLTATGFLHFKQAGARSSVIEVGMGGRLDATNVVQPLVCGITDISFDHTEILGDTLSAIAGEKAGIIKPGVPVVSAAQRREPLETISRIAAERHAPLTIVGKDVTFELGAWSVQGQRFTVATSHEQYEVKTPLLGDHQAENASVAIAIAEQLSDSGLRLTKRHILQGLATVSWPGRLEVLSKEPLIVADGAHNPHSMGRLAEAIRKYFPNKLVVLVLGLTKAKDTSAIIAELAGLPAIAIATRSRHPRAAETQSVNAGLSAAGIRSETAADTASAIARAKGIAGSGDLILVSGSLFVVAEARETVLHISAEPHSWTAPGAAVLDR